MKKLTIPLERLLGHYQEKCFKHGKMDKEGFEAYQRQVNKLKEYDTKEHERYILITKHVYRYQLE